MKRLSIVVPMHNESENITPLFLALEGSVSQLKSQYSIEYVLVDDGSTDDTAFLIGELARETSLVTPVYFSRNFGKEAATTAGLRSATGDAVLVIDADLQHPPELIPDFVKKWEEGAEVVIGVRNDSVSESWIKRFGSRVFYRLIALVSVVPIVAHATDYRLLDRIVVDEFAVLTEHNRMTRGLIDWLGFRREYIAFDARARERGTASYSLPKLISLAGTTFISFSLLPLRLAGYLGLLIMFGSGLLGVVMMIDRYIHPMGFQFSGPAILAVIILFNVGIILVSLGVLAYYVGQIYQEVHARPLYVLRRHREGQKKSPPRAMTPIMHDQAVR